MKTKALSLTLAGLMSIQSVGFAQSSRVDSVGNQAIESARTNLQSLNQDISALNQSLEITAIQIEKRDQRGNAANTIAMIGAGLGLTMTAATYFAVRLGGEGAGVLQILGQLLTFTTTTGSALFGIGGNLRKTDVNPQQLQKDLESANKNVEASLAQTKDKAVISNLTQLGLAVKNTQDALASYTEQESEISRSRLATQLTQLTGATLLAYGGIRGSGMAQKALTIGVTLVSVGNIGSIVTGLKKSEASQVLTEIRRTQETLKSISSSLQ